MLSETSSNLVVKIHGLAFSEGQGVGRSDSGKIYFVDYACPGDLVEIEVYQESKKFGFARIAKIIEPSPLRIEPKCSVFGVCGGCSLQHINYQTQVEQKQKVLEKFYASRPNFKLETFIPSDIIFGYRTRAEVHIKNKKWGFYKKKSKNLIFPETCPIVNQKIQNQLPLLDQSDGHYHIDAQGVQPRTRGLEGVFEQINENIDAKIKLFISDYLVENMKSSTKIYDLYAGHGNFSLFLAARLKNHDFVAVEQSRSLIAKGKLLQPELSQITWVCSDVLAFLKSSQPEIFNDCYILVNPPREGLDSLLIKEILRLKPLGLIYISCNPMTLFRDIDALSPILKLEALKGFDMFPQTMHFETLAFLKPT